MKTKSIHLQSRQQRQNSSMIQTSNTITQQMTNTTRTMRMLRQQRQQQQQLVIQMVLITIKLRQVIAIGTWISTKTVMNRRLMWNSMIKINKRSSMKMIFDRLKLSNKMYSLRIFRMHRRVYYSSRFASVWLYFVVLNVIVRIKISTRKTTNSRKSMSVRPKTRRFRHCKWMAMKIRHIDSSKVNRRNVRIQIIFYLDVVSLFWCCHIDVVLFFSSGFPLLIHIVFFSFGYWHR